MKITSDGKNPVFIAIDVSKDELPGSIYSKRQSMFNSTQNNDFSKKIEDICIISSTNIDLIWTIKWYIDKYIRHKEVATSF